MVAPNKENMDRAPAGLAAVSIVATGPPGTWLQVAIPGGSPIMAVVPEGCAEGQYFTVTAGAEPSGRGAASLSSRTRHPKLATHRSWLRTPCPPASPKRMPTKSPPAENSSAARASDFLTAKRR